MKKILFALGVLSASFAQAQTINLSDLSEYEKKVHRLAWCREMGAQMVNEKVPEFDYQISFEVFRLMDSNGFFKNDWAGNKVSMRTSNDLKTEVILGKTFTAEEAAQCNEDAKAILKDNYIPNFAYMEK